MKKLWNNWNNVFNKQNMRDEHLQNSQSALEEAEESVPFYGTSGKISLGSARLQKTTRRFGKQKSRTRQRQEAVEGSKQQQQTQEDIAKELSALIPEKWKEAKEAASLSKQEVDDANKR